MTWAQIEAEILFATSFSFPTRNVKRKIYYVFRYCIIDFKFFS